MNTTTLISETKAVKKLHIPNWLNNCLTGDQNDPHNSLICRAFNFAYSLHEGQYRKSGEPYIAHPVAVAELLRDLGGDSEMIAAGFLHDVVEDTEITCEEIEALFGANVRQLVEAVTKLSKYNFSSKKERQAENFRRMFVAMAQDIRVIVVKLADRLHNMRTLEFLPPEKQRLIAEETKEIFAPLANRLGIWHFKWELEDLSFKYLNPIAYNNIKNLVSERRKDREGRIENVIAIVNRRLNSLGINPIEVKGRPKHLYGIYHKMELQHKEFDQIYDMAGVRIIVNTNDECYRALAVVHDAFRPIPRRFKDYIGLPKPNLYQSLHTTVVNSNGRPLEIQIRTLEMHNIAEYGIAAHWKYKEAGNSNNTHLSSDEEKFTWLRQLLDWQKDLKDAQEYVDNLKENLFDDDVYAFTPKGEVIPLTRGATVVDFAYRIHSEVGNRMKGARINSKWCPLDQSIQNGDIVEIITSNNSHPSLDWLNYAVTPSAKNRIRQWYKRSHRDENIARGRELLEKELGKNGLESLLKSDTMQKVAQKCNFVKVDDLLASLGYGEITCMQVISRLREENKQQQPEVKTQPLGETPLATTVTKTYKEINGNKYPICGIEGLMYHIAGCCRPLPGENIIGVVTNIRGISIHHLDCPNLSTIPGERLIPVSWNSCDSKSRNSTYPVDIVIEALDRVGILRDILGRLTDQNINVSNAGVKTDFGKPALISLTIDVQNATQFRYVINQIKNMSDILNIRRVSEVSSINK
ncbi:MAG: bifunctional (p)ppGpp synthetase/guanosine-3',5'-bis(diphosphate) 3'-pyrophosphohydrolase [Cyanobacteria bacterium]|nr:bifunctional (p)ppGpp synthetase/guanosine-3',5'-bis(diphosphate) 3'-pyrophosphohydrolase [Cyanobacteria bacterium CG_2015-16_32_12]NCO77599.1 bifunctional (p)ppGpp synthetase/guanosine-3',5'-bis(diphosphate) 3'-pyrophosphohydrolase [Cyanobacteria bacterium CG_2015-22_32_23]NCQ05690.1 bifunctional (p)ppGpp synthetase/guanosine-3',5'-bis(diphosphate) 3'-pyrophosphohydrolase [Cyanobacteria bacterium CG_2015-09_32_10]NCQ41891.1 bifunctional (p)ppGpp synthetase/guanosine-3',5'-bis(diphosphate) 3'